MKTDFKFLLQSTASHTLKMLSKNKTKMTFYTDKFSLFANME